MGMSFRNDAGGLGAEYSTLNVRPIGVEDKFIEFRTDGKGVVMLLEEATRLYEYLGILLKERGVNMQEPFVQAGNNPTIKIKRQLSRLETLS